MQKNARELTFSQSARELKKTQCLVVCAMMVALNIVLSRFTVIYLSPTSRISFGYLAIAVVAMLYGACPAMLVGAAADIVGALAFPAGAYFPGYTLSAAVGGFIYAIFLNRKQLSWQIIAAQAVHNLLVNVLLGSLWRSVVYGKAYLAYLPAQLTKNAIMLPIEAGVLFILYMLMQRVMPVLKRQTCR
ncbi:MAG: folate family ECF transporter S component [Eubacteriales bacterium]|nr:folate family ECF transporter S component [Eubacteriales bacterium]MDD3883094.1 folate family ECF transporter S component [Eubacteriales bacterium]MDD4512619.1 folate family ECF transporter S component [Eubacteriales bacterium]